MGSGISAPCPWVLGHWQPGAGWPESPGCFTHPCTAPEQSLAATEENLQENWAAEDKNGYFSRLYLPSPAKLPATRTLATWLYPSLTVPAQVAAGLFQGALCTQTGSQGSPRLRSDRALNATV